MAVASGGPSEKLRFAFPSAFTVHFGVTVAVWLVGFIVPTCAYKTLKSGAPVPGSSHSVDAGLSFGDA
jgi:hypothetical protein